jgi:hypothetical protein
LNSLEKGRFLHIGAAIDQVFFHGLLQMPCTTPDWLSFCMVLTSTGGCAFLKANGMGNRTKAGAT